MYYEGKQALQTVEFSIIIVGELKVPSGFIIAQDPGWDIDLRYSFIRSIAPGDYPVLLSLASFTPLGIRRITCAKIQISHHKPIRWEVAVVDSDAPEDEQGYSVDSGTGCFMDLEAARLLKQKICPDLEDEEMYISDANEISEDSWENRQDAFFERVASEMKRNKQALADNVYEDDRRGDWTNICINETLGANIIIFGTGGDGGYNSYWGYDKDDQICCLITDFFHNTVRSQIL